MARRARPMLLRRSFELRASFCMEASSSAAAQQCSLSKSRSSKGRVFVTCSRPMSRRINVWSRFLSASLCIVGVMRFARLDRRPLTGFPCALGVTPCVSSRADRTRFVFVAQYWRYRDQSCCLKPCSLRASTTSLSSGKPSASTAAGSRPSVTTSILRYKDNGSLVEDIASCVSRVSADSSDQDAPSFPLSPAPVRFDLAALKKCGVERA